MLSLPRSIHSSLGIGIVRAESVAGGCISPAARLELDDGTQAFVKWAQPGDVPHDFFAAEANSLRALAEAATVRVPQVRHVGETWLLLEWLEPGRAGRHTWERLGAQLAQLHRVQSDSFGWHANNYIGSLPQRNRRHAAWPDFWREERLLPQWRAARGAGHIAARDERTFERMLAQMDGLLVPATQDGPSLLHGDLWNGNVHVMASNEAALIDPSCSYGHREVDLAMAELFGGFDRTFFDAYSEAWPLSPGYEESRRPIYQLYYLLVHVNLFGAGYVASAMRAVTAVAG